eukprot:TRINITY_DN2986_c0_g1_i1.p1 TRINITY_DN2986_c0_g1~~TRINITY_DN2986_c0_g1_i1.p1  ORF type:complete len:930 (-),score=179.60 TRINITY_DN2986_c0_g1_i1:320-3109(-)
MAMAVPSFNHRVATPLQASQSPTYNAQSHVRDRIQPTATRSKLGSSQQQDRTGRCHVATPQPPTFEYRCSWSKIGSHGMWSIKSSRNVQARARWRDKGAATAVRAEKKGTKQDSKDDADEGNEEEEEEEEKDEWVEVGEDEEILTEEEEEEGEGGVRERHEGEGTWQEDSRVGRKGGEEEEEYILIGSIAGTHGLNGEMKIRSFTDFPEERFGKGGQRWLQRPGMQQRRRAKPQLEAVRLLPGGRVGPSRKGPSPWLIKLEGISTVEQAETMVGCSLWVPSDDRPPLEEGDFYAPELLGLKVLLQDTGNLVGTIEDVVNSGASDLLRVRLIDDHESSSDEEGARDGDKSKDAERPPCRPRLVLIPFVKEIVPVVDMKRGVVKINPPAGLLDLAPAPETKAKRETRHEAVKLERKRRQKVAAAKKRYSAAGQSHVLAGLSEGEPEDRARFLEQLLDMDWVALNRAMQQAGVGYKGPQLSSTSNGAGKCRPEVSPTPHVFIPPSPPTRRLLMLPHPLEANHLPPSEEPRVATPLAGRAESSRTDSSSSRALSTHADEDRNGDNGGQRSGVTEAGAGAALAMMAGAKESEEEQEELLWERGLRMVADREVAALLLMDSLPRGSLMWGAGGLDEQEGSFCNAEEATAAAATFFAKQAEQLRRLERRAWESVGQPGEGPESVAKGGARGRPLIPWLIITSTEKMHAEFEELFRAHENFGLHSSQVCFLRRPLLPCVAAEAEEGRHRLLLSSPHCLAEAPNGRGGVFQLLHSSNSLDRLQDWGVKLVQIYSSSSTVPMSGNQPLPVLHPPHLALHCQHNADVAIPRDTFKSLSSSQPDEPRNSHDTIKNALQVDTLASPSTNDNLDLKSMLISMDFLKDLAMDVALELPYRGRKVHVGRFVEKMESGQPIEVEFTGGVILERKLRDVLAFCGTLE